MGFDWRNLLMKFRDGFILETSNRFQVVGLLGRPQVTEWSIDFQLEEGFEVLRKHISMPASF